MTGPLKNYNILLVDPDTELARVVRDMLSDMGFANCTITPSGMEAFRLLQNKPFDFLITEWNAQQMDGMKLLQKIRRSPDSLHPTIPAIMLTGRAETQDVTAARDAGINEYVRKPFSAKAVFSRIERIIENPRQFVVSSSFIGPTRRMKGAPPPGTDDRRIRKLQPQVMPKDIYGEMHGGQDAPKIWLPDFSLKYKLGAHMSLGSLITAAVLDQAQAAVDAIGEGSLAWIKEDLSQMRALVAGMEAGEYSSGTPYVLGELALSINGRAGTFGYGRASEIAYLLYLFCTRQFDPSRSDHHMVVHKHMDVLHVILGNRMLGSAGALGEQMVAELKRLTGKFG